MRVNKIRLWNIAGYVSLTWDRIQADLNFLIGPNGAGKSTLLQALSTGLYYICGRRVEDVLTRTYPEGEIELELDEIAAPQRFRLGDINKSQTPSKSPFSFQILQFVEHRQPKSVLGDGRSDLRQHATSRYANSVSEIKFLLASNEEDRKLAHEVLNLCKSINASGSRQDWEWIERAIGERSQRKARPVSCGQFDIVALLLDLVRLKTLLKNTSQPAFIFLDNPETYLHPACQEPVIGLVRGQIPDAQLFISSHSLKLLCHREPKCVYWLSRQLQNERGEASVLSVRELKGGTRAAFFDLYGDDVSSAVLALLTTFQNPEYYKFLCECALPSKVEHRKSPRDDRQIQIVGNQLERHPWQWTILDYAAGYGDLLEGLIAFAKTGSDTTYIALDRAPSHVLLERMEEAKGSSKISVESRVITSLGTAQSDCDAIILLNVCHEIPLPELPALFAKLLSSHLRRSSSSKVIIHEVKVMPVGERQFIIWTPEDFKLIFRGIPGIRVRTRVSPPPGVPLDTTVISIIPKKVTFDNLKDLLTSRFWNRLPAKKEECLRAIERLSSSEVIVGTGLDEMLRQRELAFFTAQLAHVCLLERQQRKVNHELLDC